MLRLIKHLFSGRWRIRSLFPEASMQAIRDRIALSEKKHRGEIVFAIEASMNLREILAGKTPREKATEAFSRLRVWDTEENNGVLIYLLLADRDIEILADRGVYRAAGSSFFEEICRAMEESYRKGDFLNGSLEGIDRISQKLEELYPRDGRADENELPDRPAVL
jgi:uncharacterized membrane protein